MKSAQTALIALVLAFLCSGCTEAHNSPAKVDPPHVPELRHIWVTTGQPPPGKHYKVLGKISYAEPWSAQAPDPARMAEKLRELALAKYPSDVDALIEEDSQVSADGSTITASATAIQYKPKDELDPRQYERVVNPPESG